MLRINVNIKKETKIKLRIKKVESKYKVDRAGPK